MDFEECSLLRTVVLTFISIFEDEGFPNIPATAATIEDISVWNLRAFQVGLSLLPLAHVSIA